MTEERIITLVRVRPLSDKELLEGQKAVIDASGTTVTATDPAYFYSLTKRDTFERIFQFDGCLGQDDTQDELYQVCGQQQLESVFNGINCAILAFGQTGSGKTFSMLGNEESCGIIPRLCRDMLSSLHQRVAQATEHKAQSYQLETELPILHSITLSVSFYEIYNEKVHDLLSESYESTTCRVREHPIDGAYVDGLNIFKIESYEEALYALAEGQKHRSVAATLMNSSSSRSHAVFTILVEQEFVHRSSQSRKYRRSKVSLVDLAGSEKINLTGVAGDRLVEANNINKSLSTLSDVIKALSESSKKESTFVPYRNSTLTWLLKDSLGGNSKTIMLGTIHPSDRAYQESLSTLRYLERAKMVKTRAVINESSDSDVAVAKLQSSLSRLQSRLDDATDIIKSQQSELERLQQDSNSSTELDTEQERRKESESQICYLQNLLYSKIQDNDTLAQELERTLDVSKEILEEKAKRESEVQTLLVQVDQLTDVNKELLESMEGMLEDHHRKEAEYVQTIRDMTYENEELKRKLNESYAGKSSLEEEMRDKLAIQDELMTALKAEIITAQTEAGKSFASRVLAFDAEMSSLMDANEDLAAQLLRADNDALRYRAKMNDLHLEVDEERTKRLSVSEDVDKLRSQAGDVQELRGVLETARSQLVECQRDRDKWKGECDSLQDAVDMFQTSKETLQKELKRVTDLYEASESDLSSARRKLSESSQEVKDLQQLKTETIDLQSVLSMLREVNSRIDAELVEKNKTIVNSTLFIGELKAEVAMLSVESEGHQKGMVRVTAELVEARSLLDKYREINDWIEREMCKSPDSISYATTREYIEQLIEAKNHSTALLLENSQLLEALSSSGHSHIVLEVEDALCQTEDEITNESSIQEELNEQNDLEYAYREIERRNEELKKKLAEALVELEDVVPEAIQIES